MSGRRRLCLTLCVAIVLGILSGCDGGQTGPQSSPENVVRAWIEAVRHGNCDKAESYTHPDARSQLPEVCGPWTEGRFISFVEVRIDEVDVNFREPDEAEVALFGYFRREDIRLPGMYSEADTWRFTVVRLDGRWHVLDWWGGNWQDKPKDPG